MNWIIENWKNILAVYGAVVSLCTTIVKITPSVKDDAVLAKVLKAVEKKDKYKLYGELLQAYGYGIEPGAKFAEVENYYDNNNLIQIPLDPELSALENSKKYAEKSYRILMSCLDWKLKNHV